MANVLSVEFSHTLDIDPAVHDRLDALWTRYLNILDEYTSAQAIIKKHLANGFFALTQANYKSPGRRYGQDYYDGRAIAISKAQIFANGQVQIIEAGLEITSDEAHVIQQKPTITTPDGTNRKDGNVERYEQNQTQCLLSPSPTPEPDESSVRHELNISETGVHSLDDQASCAASMDGNGKNLENPVIQSNDPIRWFGILVPPVLRQAQTSFKSAVQTQSAVAQAVNAIRDMREVETEIRKLRKVLRKAERDAAGTNGGST